MELDLESLRFAHTFDCFQAVPCFISYDKASSLIHHTFTPDEGSEWSPCKYKSEEIDLPDKTGLADDLVHLLLNVVEDRNYSLDTRFEAAFYSYYTVSKLSDDEFYTYLKRNPSLARLYQLGLNSIKECANYARRAEISFLKEFLSKVQ